MNIQPIQALDPWDAYPKIDLYMDQVLNIVNQQLSRYFKDPKGGAITASMVNNYVKQGLLPRPEKKKYRPEQVTRLIMIGILKQVLTIAQITKLFDLLLAEQEASEEGLYMAFRDSLNRSFKSMWSKEESPPLPPSEGAGYVLELALISFLARYEAASLLDCLGEGEGPQTPPPSGGKKDTKGGRRA